MEQRTKDSSVIQTDPPNRKLSQHQLFRGTSRPSLLVRPGGCPRFCVEAQRSQKNPVINTSGLILMQPGLNNCIRDK